jgi:hypothetical protein
VLDDPAGRLLLVVAAAAVAVLAVRFSGRRRPAEQDVDLTGLGLPPGVVLFTSTACGNCTAARAQLAVGGIRPREVTWELEPDLVSRSGVDGVPFTAVIDAQGDVLDQWSGVPPRWWVSRAAATARRLAAGGDTAPG